MIISKFEVLENFYSDLLKINIGQKSNNSQHFLAQNIIAQNVDLIYKRSNTMYLKILACKSQEFLGNRHLLRQFPLEHSVHICNRFCSQFYHSQQLWLHHCCWPDHSQNSCHKKLEVFILLARECKAKFFKVSHSFHF